MGDAATFNTKFGAAGGGGSGGTAMDRDSTRFAVARGVPIHEGDDTPTEEERVALGVVLGMFSRLQASPAGDPEPAEHVVYRAGADACRFVLDRARPGDPPPDDGERRR